MTSLRQSARLSKLISIFLALFFSCGTSMQALSKQKIFQRQLDNGLTVLVRPTHQVPKVSIQLWYNVGSKHEQSGEKGLAHLLEHMIFKGTERMSESDINFISSKLSGYTNAFTSYDYTAYVFDFPTRHWVEALPMLSDCMSNCTFKQELLDSELKAVIQELKMYKDRYTSALIEQMITTIFPDHPYHYPIIGFKQDLWSITRDSLMKFYKKNYVPNNAHLVVVGDVEPEQVFAEAEKYFGDIKPDPKHTHPEFYLNRDLVSKSVTMYRDVAQPQVLLAYVVPGIQGKVEYLYDVVAWVLANGKGSRLHRRLIDELQLATEVEAFHYDLTEHGIFFIYFQPKTKDDIDACVQVIQQELQQLNEYGPTQKEVQRATKKTEARYLSIFENNQNQAYALGKAFLATGDPNYLFEYLAYGKESIGEDIKNFVAGFLRDSVMHVGTLLPIAQTDKSQWAALQDLSDQEDQRILSRRDRQSPVEPPVVAHQIEQKPAGVFNFPKYDSIQLSNGLTVLYYNNTNIPKIQLVLDFKANHIYDPAGKEGLSLFMSHMLREGTIHYSAQELADEIESLGMSLSCAPGSIGMSMLSEDFERGLELLTEILINATFPQQSIEKIRTRILADLDNYWDDPNQFIGQLVRDYVYTGHPYQKNIYGTKESIASITRDDLVKFYKKVITPHQANLAIVGDLQAHDNQEILQQTVGVWRGPDITDMPFPQLQPKPSTEIVHPITRDQVVLAFVGLSTNRLDPDYDSLLLFDQIFAGGVLMSMSSRLFALREATGLFYTIAGSVVAQADEQPGMVYVKTIVSLDRLEEAIKVIGDTLKTVVDSITQQELDETKSVIVDAMVDNFESNIGMCRAFLFLQRYGLPKDYFDQRAERLQSITLEQVKTAVNKVLKPENLAIIKIGRV